ncbi:MAG: hypothetical protein K9G76_04900 [Bacteroidales bacterium]|nr:hypothetical protein [Bacteroidales bacterium]MCF8403017.1 hypothetical protein [Bacteroidales bacterium]
MSLKSTYLENASQLLTPNKFEGWKKCAWRSPSNIALIKYWGKLPGQIPINPSLSFTLKNAFTETEVKYSFKREKGLQFTFLFDQKEHPEFKVRIDKYLSSLIQYMPFLEYLNLEISSKNSFPHSSGIASSASAMSALALCLVSIENELFGTLADEDDFYQKASFLARLGSGSAARSVYGDFVVWGHHNFIEGSSDEAGIPYNPKKNNPFNKLMDAILITDRKKKSISSSAGHALMKDHPFSGARIKQAELNLIKLARAMEQKNEEEFIQIIENEALSLHALMMSSMPGYNLLNTDTWEIINKIRKYREESGIMVGFTLDAGPNVHLIYFKKDKNEVLTFIKNALLQHCDDNYWIDDEMGKGPKKLN